MTRARSPATRARDRLRQVAEVLAAGVIVYERDGALSFANAKAVVMHAGAGSDGFGDHVGHYAERFELRACDGAKLAEREYPASRGLRGESVRDVVVQVAPRGAASSSLQRVNVVVLKDEDGGLDLVVVVLDDMTKARDAERRFEQAFAADPAPSAICRIGDLRFVKVNDGFLAMTGYDSDNVIGHSIYEIDVLEGARRRDLAIRNLEAGVPIPRMEAELRLACGGAKPVLVAGQPIEVTGRACMLFTFVDLELARHPSTTAPRLDAS